MKCPFQTNEHGEFLDCFGELCMAYYEVGNFQYLKDENSEKPKSIPMCKRLIIQQVYPYQHFNYAQYCVF